MGSKVSILFEALEGKKPSVYLLEDKLKIAIETSADVSSIISEINNEMYLTKDFHNDRVPFYWFYLSIAYYFQDEHEKAKDALATSILGFQTQGLNYNEAIGEFLFGIIHYKDKKNERARRACNSASAIVQDLIKQCKLKREYQRAKIYIRYLRKINALNRLINIQFLPSEKREETPQPQTTYQQDYLFLQWLPIYENVRAGKNGIVWGSTSAHNGTTVHNVELDGKQHMVFSTNSSKKIVDHQITLKRKDSYYWAKVKGHSMNASNPIHIEDGDYVLCSSTWSNDHDAIVIAGFMLKEQDALMMVKKYVATNKILVSETSDSSEDYSPIQMTVEYQILGTVIAVAKAIK